MRKFLPALILLFSAAALADTGNEEPGLAALTGNGTDLGRVALSDLTMPLVIQVSLLGDAPDATYVMARFKNNQPRQRRADGYWVPWNGASATLIDNELMVSEEGTLTFEIVDEDISGEFLPIIFTVAYRTDEGIKSGYLVIDQ